MTRIHQQKQTYRDENRGTKKSLNCASLPDSDVQSGTNSLCSTESCDCVVDWYVDEMCVDDVSNGVVDISYCLTSCSSTTSTKKQRNKTEIKAFNKYIQLWCLLYTWYDQSYDDRLPLFCIDTDVLIRFVPASVSIDSTSTSLRLLDDDTAWHNKEKQTKREKTSDNESEQQTKAETSDMSVCLSVCVVWVFFSLVCTCFHRVRVW